MLDYARQRAAEALRIPRSVVLATSGPAGMQVGEYPCESVGLRLYLLLPQTSDHLFNLENNPAVSLLASAWELKGEASVAKPGDAEGLAMPDLQGDWMEYYALVYIEPSRLQIRRETGWGEPGNDRYFLNNY